MVSTSFALLTARYPLTDALASEQLLTHVRIDSGGVHYWDNDAWVDSGETVDENEWANFWMVVNRNPGVGTWDLYMTTGEKSATTSDRIATGVGFVEGNDFELGGMFLRGTGSFTSGVSGNRTGHLNDIYFSEGENLTFMARIPKL